MRELLRAAALGSACGIVVSGDAGIGKTALVRHCVDNSADVTLLQGPCLPLQAHSIPLLPIISILRHLPTGIEPPPDVLGDPGAALTPVIVDAWLTRLCRLRPVVLFVDDLHWADPATLDVLMYLLAGPRDRRLAVVGTVRRTDLGPGNPLNPWLADVRRMRGFIELGLGPLSWTETHDQVTALLGAPTHESLVDEVFDRTLGNAYLNQLLTRDLDPRTRELPTHLPTDLQGALVATWHRLGPNARELTAVMALAGLRLTATDLAKVIPLVADLPDLGGLLAEAVEARVLELGMDGSYWFHHPLQVEVLQALLAPEERARWHEVFASYLEERANEPGPMPSTLAIRLADHHERAGHTEDARSWLHRASEIALSEGNRHDALRLLRRLVDLLDDESTPGRRLGILTQLLDLAFEIGEVRSERQAVDDLVALLDPDEAPLRVARLMVRRRHLQHALGEVFTGAQDATVAVALSTTDPGSWIHAYCLAEQASISMWTGDPRAEQAADEALARARGCGDLRALPYALTARAMTELIRPSGSDLELATQLVQEACRAALATGDHWAYVHATLWEGNATVRGWCSTDGLATVQRAREVLAAVGAAPAYLAWLGSCEASTALTLGQVDRCEGLLRTLLGMRHSPISEVLTRLTAARLSARRGLLSEARAHLDRAEELVPDLYDFHSLEGVAARIEVLLAEGDFQSAAQHALDAARSDGFAATMSDWIVPLGARALADHLESLRREAADDRWPRAALAELRERYPPPPDATRDRPSLILDLEWTTDWGQRQVAALSLWYAAECARADGLDDGDLWERAGRALESVDFFWEAAYALSRAGSAHLRQEKPDRAAAARSLRSSAALARRLGATAVLSDVEQQARSARISLVAPRAVDASALGGLTPRENELLAHLVAGRTYREIAEALVLSEKTVSSHVSNMLRKTGSTNRHDLSRMALQRGANARVDP